MKSCALVGAVDFNKKDFLKRYQESSFDAVFAVDGGFAHLEQIGIFPDKAIGDFDSLGFVPNNLVVLKHPVIKDQSDMELALEHAFNQGFDTFWIYGALSGRLDHTVANLQLFARFSEAGARVTGIGDDFAVTLLTGPGEFEIPAQRTGTVSVFAASDVAVGVCEQGMQYFLENRTLTNRMTLGLSNELVGESGLVSLTSGSVYIFHPLS